ncbi:MAG: S26 family signal peptidase [Psychrosphaera sp.]|nr:S26 family signal peptidase [Psychrosphaera sp.]
MELNLALMMISSEKAMTVMMAMLIPGWGHLFQGHKRVALAFQALLISAVLVFAWSRFILHPLGLMTLLLCIVSTHLVSLLMACHLVQKPSNHRGLRSSGQRLLFGLFFVTVALAFYYFRATVLGFALYVIPSKSMTPTLAPGDVIIVDTWVYRKATGKPQEIVIFSKPYQSNTIHVKRISETAIDKSSGKTRYFLLGDNKHKSSDSRHFGWMQHATLKGKVTAVLFSYTASGLTFTRNSSLSPVH